MFKNLSTLFVLFISVNSLFAQEINYHFLDSNFVEVFLKKPDKISYKERKIIYYYIEYKVNDDNYVDNFKVYYADGCIPSVEKNKIITNTRPYLSFANPKERKGLLCGIYNIMWKKSPLSFRCWEKENYDDTTCFTVVDRTPYYPNGQKRSQKIRYNMMFFEEDGEFSQKIKSKSLEFYNSDGSLNYINYYNKGERTRAVQTLDNGTERVWYYNDDIVKSVSDFKNGQKIANYYYTNGKFDDSKTEKFGKNGKKLFAKEWTEKNVKEYLDSQNNLAQLEGLYTVNSTSDAQLNYVIAVLENEDGKLIGHQLSGYMYNAKAWKAGETRVTFEEIAVENFYKVMWLSDYKKQEINNVVQDETGGALLSFGNYVMIKLYPKYSSQSSSSKKRPISEDWKGNGSGLIISKTGYIVTNNHVTEDASEIEVEFKYKNEIVSFKARVIQQDVLNDLAIIKIDDNRFSSFSSIPYGYKSRNVDVGTKVYAYGYPRALAGMGKEVKVTDGIISSKTGYQGDITKYQISAAIQGGNSGGPLFDSNGNLIGINVAKLESEKVDNVAYSIKTNYLLNLLDVLPESIDLPKNSQLTYKTLIEQIKVISDYVVLIKIK